VFRAGTHGIGGPDYFEPFAGNRKIWSYLMSVEIGMHGKRRAFTLRTGDPDRQVSGNSRHLRLSIVTAKAVDVGLTAQASKSHNDALMRPAF